MTEAELDLLLIIAGVMIKLAIDSGRVADAQDIRDAIQRVEEEQRNR